MNLIDGHINNFIRHLLSATANASLYGTAHPQVIRLSSQAYDSICALLQINQEIKIFIVENELVINNQPQEASLFLNRFAQILTANGISSIRLSAGVTKAELIQLITGLSRQLADNCTPLSSSNSIRLGVVDLKDSGNPGNTFSDNQVSKKRFKLPEMPKEEMAKFMEIYDTVKNRRKIQINGVAEVVTGFINVFNQEGKPLLAMASLRDTDEYTFTHSTNVCVLNIAQAMALGIEGQLLNEIGVAAMLHDIGKLFIPEEILTKADKLTDQEYEIMKQHPVKGARHLLETPGVPRLAVITAYEHHLKYNRSGYPAVQQNWQQNLCSHMTMISDFFDALRTRRSYREPMPLNVITAIMTDMIGTDLHPSLTRNFLEIIGKLSDAIDTPQPSTA